ncbi:hypothetical protein AK812_SmicGene947 [Symbiodinium microadriaticum]|uniref:Uncharacterized protein n=1 Tax=Symbiodinium microadriaticum TaxID=2951 RepID=A0A1Q9F5D0_SYMMI|nr:hypothetical protein AK812_SmicGene947 [Symbiodinium microadriaticum]
MRTWAFSHIEALLGRWNSRECGREIDTRGLEEVSEAGSTALAATGIVPGRAPAVVVVLMARNAAAGVEVVVATGPVAIVSNAGVGGGGPAGVGSKPAPSERAVGGIGPERVVVDVLATGPSSSELAKMESSEVSS